jgi:hypothetical protein
MHKIKSLGKILLILGFISVIFGCATSKPVSSEPEPSEAQQSMDIGLKAETVQEGICITFDYIPPETTYLFIGIQKGIEKSPPVNPHNIIFNFSVISDDALEQVKRTGKVIFPIVQSGEIYSIDVSFNQEGYLPIEGIPEWINAECIAGAGIYFNRNIELRLDKAHTTATLSSEPVFSSKVVFDDDKYSYNMTIIQKFTETELQSIGIRDKNNTGLKWVFEPECKDILIEDNALEEGNYSAFITAFCNIIYDNINWFVEIAKSPEFTYSF